MLAQTEKSCGLFLPEKCFMMGTKFYASLGKDVLSSFNPSIKVGTIFYEMLYNVLICL
jgi:hypothetical protein